MMAVAFMAASFSVSYARDQIKIVGSSTVYPFSSYVAEELGQTTKFKTPVVESTGSGGGHKIFAKGVGENYVDITNSSRRMKKSELEKDMAAGIKKVIEVKIGFDGIAITNSKEAASMNLTLEELAMATLEKVPMNGKLVANPYKKWSDINPKLPNSNIRIYGPPTSSGTRDAFEELVLHKIAKKYKGILPKKPGVRKDGAYIPAGENDNLIVQRLEKDKKALGIFGYSYLMENADKIQAVTIDGITPGPKTVASGKYPISRSLFFYIKADHLGKIAGMEEYVDLFLSEKMIGPKGLLKEIGLIPLPDDERAKYRAAWKSRKALTTADLK